jgi:F0F1-type ATP synthase membrane subunit c/vacuolar-type H+-ATPase subunit K
MKNEELRIRKTMKWFALFFILTSSLFIPSVGSIHAQVPGFDVARTFGGTDEVRSEGDIVSFTRNQDELELSKVAGDSRMYGVLVINPLVVYRTTTDMPVVSTGEVLVNVTTLSGPILEGDFVTSSEIPGKGQKASSDMRGYMLGYALSGMGEGEGESLSYKGKEYRQGQIRVSINIRPISFTGGNVFATLQQAQAASLDIIQDQKSRDRYFRYIIALLIVLITVYFSYRTFGKNVSKGIEGIGRNPLAKVSIQSMIVLNMILIGAVCIGGMVLALLVISL